MFERFRCGAGDPENRDIRTEAMKSRKLSLRDRPFGRGRPPVDGGEDCVVSFRMPASTLLAVDNWSTTHGISRSEACRQLIELGLKDN
jgi:hypothetical protein